MFFLTLLLTLAFGEVVVYDPDDLKEAIKNRYNHNLIKSSLANFGNPPYGSLIIGKVYYRESEKLGCDSLTPFD